jgi:putative two-component system response regulator
MTTQGSPKTCADQEWVESAARNLAAETILVVDDDPEIASLLHQALTQQGYQVEVSKSGEEALDVVHHQRVGTVITDIQMPGISGLSVLAGVKTHDADIQVVVMTGSTENKPLHFLQAGADDFLAKPFDMEAVLLSTSRAMEKRRLLLENRCCRENIEWMVTQRLAEANQDNLEVIRALAEAIELKDPFLRGHSQRVRLMSRRLAAAVDLENSTALEAAALLHDIGRISVPGRILGKAEHLTDPEFDEVKKHPVMSERLIAHLPAFRAAAPAVRNHHERYDGQGYPDGLGSSDIPLEARILAVADAYDAMTSPRPHRPAKNHTLAAYDMVTNRGRHLDPDLVEAFLDVGAYKVATA